MSSSPFPFRRRRAKPKRLVVAVQGIGNAVVVCGTRDPHFVKSEIVLGSGKEWIDVTQPAGRLTIRTSAIVGAWIEGDDA